MLGEHAYEVLPRSAEDVRKALAYIEAISGDSESAHSAEDNLHQDVLIAVGAELITGKDAAEIARLALGTRDISFDRWYA